MAKHSAKANRKRFDQELKLYSDAGLLREIYKSEHVCIISVGEVCYIACPYFLVCEEMVGLYATETIIRKLIKNDRYIYPLMEELLHDPNQHKGSIFTLSERKIQIYEQWIEDNRKKGISAIDLELEKEIAQMTKNSSAPAKTGLLGKLQSFLADDKS